MEPIDEYASHYGDWQWNVPAQFNIAAACAHKWATDPVRASGIAIRWEDESGAFDDIKYAELARRVNRLASALAGLGLKRGDRIAICLPQRIETAVSLLAILQLGAVAVPLTVLFGPEALAYRLNHAQCKLAICDSASLANMLSVRGQVPLLKTIITCAGAVDATAIDWHELLKQGSDQFEVATTAAADPAFIIYTSGTTGPPKGAIIPHRALFGNLSGFTYSHNQFPQPGDIF